MKSAALKLATDYGYNSVRECDFDFEKKHVFIACFDEVYYTGLPQFILVSDKKEAEFAEPITNLKIFDIYVSTRHREDNTGRAQ